MQVWYVLMKEAGDDEVDNGCRLWVSSLVLMPFQLKLEHYM